MSADDHAELVAAAQALWVAARKDVAMAKERAEDARKVFVRARAFAGPHFGSRGGSDG